MALTVGAHLGPYQILAPLGAGGMGEVYRARDSRLDREVAVKVLPEHLARDAAALARFEREARAVAALSHPNILAVYDVGVEQGTSYVVMELLEGETLRTRLGGAELAWRKAVETTIAVADGLAEAHAKGVTHRDLKPENIFLTSDGRVKILDFGLARYEPRQSSSGATAAETATEPGTVLGTLGYMSPEQVRGERAEAASDIFSLGSILYEMISGRRAFARATPVETMTAILREEPPEISSKQFSPELPRLIAHCLEKQPAQRFHSAHDLAYALRSLLSTPSTIAKAAPAPRQRKAIDSLAVLPFANLSGDPDAEYLGEGITENLINSLSELPKLRVAPRSRVFRYKGRQLDPRKVGRELKVRAIVTGRVMHRGDTLNVRAELEDLEAEAQLWGQQYNRQFADIFAVQEEIAREIADALRLRLTGEERKRLAKRHTENTEAYQSYLKGRFHWNRRTPESIRKGIEHFQQAIALDPAFAPAHAGLGGCFSLLGFYSMEPAKEVFPRAKAALRRALEMDDRLAEAHAVLGLAASFFDWDWTTGEKEFRRAIEIDPDNSLPRYYYAMHLSVLGRFEEALQQAKRAEALDPLSPAMSSGTGFSLVHARRYEEAIAQLRKCLDLDPNFYLGRGWLGLAYHYSGQLQEAISEYQTALALAPGNPAPMAWMGHAHAMAGDRQQALKTIEELRALSARQHVSSDLIAMVYAGLDPDEMFAWLDKACEERSVLLPFVAVSPMADPYRADPRYQELLRRMGLGPMLSVDSAS